MSAAVTNPIFAANTFYLPIQENRLFENPRLHFAAFVVTDHTAAEQKAQISGEKKGQARLLGESVLELGALIGQLTDVVGVGVRQNLSFFRNKGGAQEVVVGRFIIILKIVGDYMTK